MQARGFLNYRLNIADWKLFTVYINQTNLKGKLRKKLGGQPKIWGSHGPPSLPLEPPLAAI